MVKIKHVRLVEILSFCNYDVRRLHPDVDKPIRIDPARVFNVFHDFLAEYPITRPEAHLLTEFGVLDVDHDDEPGSDLEVLAKKLGMDVIEVRSIFNSAIKKLSASAVLEERLSNIGLPTVGLLGKKGTHVTTPHLRYPNTFLVLETYTLPLSVPQASLEAY